MWSSHSLRIAWLKATRFWAALPVADAIAPAGRLPDATADTPLRKPQSEDEHLPRYGLAPSRFSRF